MNVHAEQTRISSPRAASLHLEGYRARPGATGLLVTDCFGVLLLEKELEGGFEAMAPREIFRVALAGGPRAKGVTLFVVADDPQGYAAIHRGTALRLRKAGDALGFEFRDFLVLGTQPLDYASIATMGWPMGW